MAKVSKDGQNFFEIPDDPEELSHAQEKGYRAYTDVTKDGQNTFTIPVEELPAATQKGYRAATAAATPKPDPQVIDEAHPAIRTMDRALVQNFTNTAAEKVSYLKREYPDLEIKADAKDPQRVLIRKPDEQDFHVLSPSFSPLSHPINTLKDLPGQILDAGADFAKGTAEGAAGGAGAIGGGAVGTFLGGPGLGTGVGAYGTAAAASGAAGAGMEALRQKIGQGFGLSKGYDGNKIAMDGATGALAPFVFGAGGAAKGAVPLVLGGLKNKVAPFAGELLSGVPRAALRTAQDELPVINALKDPEKKLQFIESLKKDTESKILASRNATGQALEGSVNAADQLAAATAVPKATALAPLEDYKAALLKEANDPARAAKLASVDRLIEKHGLVPPAAATGENALLEGAAPEAEFDPNLSPWAAWKKSQDLLHTARNYRQYEPEFGAAVHDKNFQNAVRLSGQALGQGVDEATGGAFSANNSKYSDVKKDMAFLDKFFDREEQQIGQKLGTLEGDAQAPNFAKMQRIDEKYGTNNVQAAKILYASKFLSNPSLFPISSKGTTSTTRSLLSEGLGTAAGFLFGGHSPEATAAGAAAGAGLQLATGPAAQKAAIAVGRAPSAAVRALVDRIPALQGLPYPEVLKLAAKYGLLSTAGAIQAAPDAASNAADGGWNMLQQYIGGQK